VSWASIIGAVALALADDRSAADPSDADAAPMLAALTGAPSPPRRQPGGLRGRRDSPQAAADSQVHQYEIPLHLLSRHLVDVAAAAAAGTTPAKFGELSQEEQRGYRIAGIVAVCALSTLRLQVAAPGDLAAQVWWRLHEFGTAGWTAALDALAERTAELHKLLDDAGHGHRHGTWRQVSAADRVLAEAAAAAVVGGAAEASGVPPERWLFPFNLFCRLALSAAEDALATIESWLWVEFAPGPHTPERTLGLALLVAAESSALHRGCPCKADPDMRTVAFAPRGTCRQADHDLGGWLPGQPKPGGRGGRYAATLWGWLRRWLGGTDASRMTGEGRASGRPKLRPNDVAGSVLARRWLHVSRGDDGPTLLYDRILPEYCLNCGHRVEVVTVPQPTGPAQVNRRPCCDRPQWVYRSDFSERAGKRVIRQKLGLIVASLGGSAGYRSTETLGPLWVCASSGRYFLSPDRCPGCGTAAAAGGHQQVGHGWVLLPLADAWADLRRSAWPAGPVAESAGARAAARPAAAQPAVSQEELRALGRAFAQMHPEQAFVLRSPADAWQVARDWTHGEIDMFRKIVGQPGLELLYRCKQAAEAAPPGDTGQSGT